MQQQVRRPPPPKSLAIVILMVGVFALGLAGNVVWGWFSTSDPARLGRQQLHAAAAALADEKPNRAARLATEAAAFLEQGTNTRATLQAYALQARALQAGGQTAEAAKALERALVFAKKVGADPQASETLAELFLALKRYGVAADYAAEAAQGIRATGNQLAAAEMLTAFAGRLAVAGASLEAVRLYAAAIEIFMQINLSFQAAQLYERIGIVLAPSDSGGAYAAYIEAINRFYMMGEKQRAEAVIKRVQQLPKAFLETIIE